MAARGLLITGTNTGVGKTFVTALIARALRDAGKVVGVYKPVASGCRFDGTDDPDLLWQAAGRPGAVEQVCPQRFRAPLAPHLAARAEGREVDARLLRDGVTYWRQRSEIVLVEGVGGLMSPLTDNAYVADLAIDLGLSLLVTAANTLGVINQTLQTLITAESYCTGLPVIGVVLNNVQPPGDDPSWRTNGRELARRIRSPLIAELPFQAGAFPAQVNWPAILGLA